MKNILFMLTGIAWITFTMFPTQFIGVAVYMTLWSINLIVNNND